MEAILGILNWLQPNSIYEKLGDVIKIYLTYMVPTALIFGIVSRYAELAARNLGDGAQWSDAIKDVKLAVFLTGVYLAFGALVVKFHSAFVLLMYEQGSIGTILGSYQKLLNSANALTENRNLFENVVGWTNFISHTTINWLFFYLTFIALILVQVLLRIIYALAFCLFYLWGMAAIPTMSSKLFNLSTGWFRSIIALALWPIIEATIFIFVDALFKGWGEALIPNHAVQAEIGMSYMCLLFAFCNIVLIGVLVAALFVSIMVARNQDMMTGLAAPVLAAGAAGFNLWKNIALKTMSTVNPLAQPTFGALAGKGGSALKRANERTLPGLWNQVKQHTGLGAGSGQGGSSTADGVLSNLDITSKGDASNGGASNSNSQGPENKGPGL